MTSDPPATLTLQGAGVELRGYDYGNAGAPPMVLVHGIEDFALGLECLAEAFREAYRVVSFDLRGHGDSGKPGVYTMAHFMADLHAVLLQLEMEKPILIGHSLGGQIVTHYAGVFSDVPATVVNIDGMGPPMRIPEPEGEDKQWRTQEGVESLLRGEGLGRPMMGIDDAGQVFMRYHPRLDGETARRLVELGTEPHPQGGLKWKWDPRIHSLRLFSSPADAEERYGWIRCPVLMVDAGEIDEFMWRRRGLDPDELHKDEDEIARRVALFRDATRVEIAGSGHHVHFDAPDDLIRVSRQFLG